jgi:catechol 2,3-dioxygenase-like lactoylglutathione lyase family enzyme
MRVTGMHHIALVTGRFAELKHFYTEILGLAVVGAFEGRNIIFL